MPRALLDTHTFLWFVTADPKLSSQAEKKSVPKPIAEFAHVDERRAFLDAEFASLAPDVGWRTEKGFSR